MEVALWGLIDDVNIRSDNEVVPLGKAARLIQLISFSPSFMTHLLLFGSYVVVPLLMHWELHEFMGRDKFLVHAITRPIPAQFHYP